MITTKTFKLPFCDKRGAAILLTAGYAAAVEAAGKEMAETPDFARAVDALAEILTDDDVSRPWIMLAGLYGNGKTTWIKAMQAVINHLNFTDSYGERVGLTLTTAKQIKPEDVERLARVRYLAIDDLGNEPESRKDYGNVERPIIELLERRYDSRYFTVLTTNLTPKEITQRYGPRISDRLTENVRKVILREPSFRRKTDVERSK